MQAITALLIIFLLLAGAWALLTIPSGSGKESTDIQEYVWPNELCKESFEQVTDSCYKIHKMDRYPIEFFYALTVAEQDRWIAGGWAPKHPNTDAYYQCIRIGDEMLQQSRVCL
jgi:hypothetical protein